MSDEPSQFIIPQYETTEGFDSASTAPIVSEQTLTESTGPSTSDADVAELEAALETIDAKKPAGAGVVDSIFDFFATVVELIKYIFRSLSNGIGIDEFQFGYIVLGLGALFMTLPLWGEPRFAQSPLPRNSRNSTVYTPVTNNKANNKRNNMATLQSQVE
jgi:hypothetical protein